MNIHSSKQEQIGHKQSPTNYKSHSFIQTTVALGTFFPSFDSPLLETFDEMFLWVSFVIYAQHLVDFIEKSYEIVPLPFQVIFY